MDSPIRILVIDDSAFNRQLIAGMLDGISGFSVIGRARDGEEGLMMALQLRPDAITLDLEMPKMDGFTFLRLLMARQPTPVIVISDHATRENVFKSLELGALDFVAKAAGTGGQELRGLKDELAQKLKLVTQLRMVTLAERAAVRSESGLIATPRSRIEPLPSHKEGAAPARLCAIGASTGGPPAITRILSALPPTPTLGIVITQHMPASFTYAFAERLGRTTPWNVREAQNGDALVGGSALVAPGSGSLTLRREGGSLKVELIAAQPSDRYTPSVDRMLTSVAGVMKTDLLAIVLTGMGNDGGRGVREVHAAGGRVIAEAPESAVIFGMPQEAIATGVVDEVLSLQHIPDAIARFAKKR